MNLGKSVKGPNEVFDYDIDYSKWLVPDDCIASHLVTIVSTDTSTNDLQVDYTVLLGDIVKVWLSKGNINSTYKINLSITTTKNRIKEDYFTLKIKDK